MASDSTKTKSTTTSPPPTTKEKRTKVWLLFFVFSMLQLLLLCWTMIGVGVIGGYMGFLRLQDGRCADVLDTMERQFIASRQDLQERYLKSVQEVQRCLEDGVDTYSRGRALDDQASSMRTHQALLQNHQDTLTELSKWQSDHSERVKEVQQLSTTSEKQQQQIQRLESDKKKCLASKKI
jgi:hypothetical protein